MIIGITGGIGAGKSTVLSVLEKNFGARTIMADEIGHRALLPGTGVCEQIREIFGEDFLKEDGSANRDALAKEVYSDDAKRQRLNELIHPFVLDEIRRQLKAWQGEPLIVLETAILFETGCDKLCDAVWGVVADKEIRIQRLIRSRGYSREKAEVIMSKQLSDEQWSERCDRLIDNNGNEKKILIQIQELLGIA